MRLSQVLHHRRKVMTAGLSLSMSGVLVGSNVAGEARKRVFIATLLTRMLPDVPIDAEVFVAFTQAYWPLWLKMQGGAARATRIAKILDDMAPGQRRFAVKLEREILTAFLLSTNFFSLEDPRKGGLVFVDIARAAKNPFYRA